VNPIGNFAKFLNFKLRDLDINRTVSWQTSILTIITTFILLLSCGLLLGSYFFGPSKSSYYDSRIKELREVLRENPGDKTIALELAMTIYLQGDTGKGISLARQVLSKYPDDPEALFNLGLMLCDRGDYVESIRFLDKLASRYPGFEPAGVSFYLGKSYLESGDFNNAHVKLREAVNLDRGSPVAYYYLGRAEEGIGNWEKALEAYQQAIRRAGSYPEAEAAARRLTR